MARNEYFEVEIQKAWRLTADLRQQLDKQKKQAQTDRAVFDANRNESDQELSQLHNKLQKSRAQITLQNQQIGNLEVRIRDLEEYGKAQNEELVEKDREIAQLTVCMKKVKEEEGNLRDHVRAQAEELDAKDEEICLLKGDIRKCRLMLMTVEQLKSECGELGIQTPPSKKKADLVEVCMKRWIEHQRQQ